MKGKKKDLYETASEQFMKLDKKQKLSVVAFLLIIFLSGLSVSYYFKIQTSSFQKETDKTTALPVVRKNLELKLTSYPEEHKVNLPFTLNIEFNSFDSPVDAADIYLDFDPFYLKAETIEEGGFFENFTLKEIGSGFVRIQAAPSFTNEALIIPQGRGIFAKVIFIPITSGQTIIKVQSEKSQSASEGQNILSYFPDIEIKVNE